MSALPQAQRKLTVEEYFVLERDSLEKHEFFAGEIFAMAGGSRQHSLISGNVLAELRTVLRQGACEVYGSDLRVYVPATGLYTYPDLSVACPPEFLAEHPDTLINPASLIEVLSDSTEAYDRGKKFENYRTISSLTDYILIAQDRILIEHYTRQSDGGWLLHEVRTGGSLSLTTLPCAKCEIPLAEIYQRVFA